MQHISHLILGDARTRQAAARRSASTAERSDSVVSPAPRPPVRRIEAKESLNGSALVVDDFSDDRAPGRVIGTRLANGIARTGVDKEGILSVDNGALRIQPLVNPGWGRAGIAYGPFVRRNGLAFSASLLNGHQISRTSTLPDGFRDRMWRWVVGSETEKPLTRIVRFLQSRQRRFVWRRVMTWFKTGTGLFPIPALDENLAVGWFPSEAPADPLKQGNAFIVHAVIPQGGDLWLRSGSRVLRSVGGLQNLPMHYVVVLREQGAAYYAASIPGVHGLPAHPRMQIVGIDPFINDEKVYGGVHQSVLGETGFRADTRVYRTEVAQLPGFDAWYGSAHAADTLAGDGPLHASQSAVGGEWTVCEGGFKRTARGVEAVGRSNTAMLELDSASGLVHVLIDAADD